MIGFSGGIPENPDRTWTKEINDRTFTFEKTREKAGVFLYRCKLGNSQTSFYSDRDLTAEEIEQARQFEHFITDSGVNMNCSDCDKPATHMFHFRNEGAALTDFKHVPRCDLHSLKNHPQAAECRCTGTWEELMQ